MENEIITKCSRTGGSKGWQLYSISRWTEEDGEKLKHHLEESFAMPERRQLYWDDLALFCYPSEYQLGIMPMQKEDVIEVDSLEELIQLDKKYEESYL